MDLVLGVAFAGYHFWNRRQKPHISVDEPYLLNVPAEIRLIIYDFLFDEQDETESASSFLEPLLTCRLIHHEARHKAFECARFSLKVGAPTPPYWSPAILFLPYDKLISIRNITILWDIDLNHMDSLRRLFYELRCGPLVLSCLTFKITSSYALYTFQYKYAPVFSEVQNFAQFIMEELPLLENVEKIVVPSPGVQSKRNFQYLFDPTKPNLSFGGTSDSPTITDVAKNLGKWEYRVVREGKDVKRWRLELTHPGPEDNVEEGITSVTATTARERRRRDMHLGA